MGVSSMTNSRMNVLGNVVSVPLSPVQNAISFVEQKVRSFLSYFEDMKAIQDENETLKLKVAELEKENNELAGYREKIKELRQALNLKDVFANYDMVGGNVIAKDLGNWFDVFRIDVGIKDNFDKDFPVLTSTRSLVGRVSESDINTAKVVSIIDEDSVVSGRISKPGGGHVIVRGDISLKEQGLCRIDYIPMDVDVTVNDIIETSGLGGIYPKGIIIGRVKEVRKKSSELNRYAIIEPAVNFKKLEEVFVLINKNNTGTGSVTK
jgi:rod shape-determining protein MreC